MNAPTHEDGLVNYLLHLKNENDRGALAALRTGLGKSPGDAPRMFAHLGKFLTSADPHRPMVVATFATAAFFAMHPNHVPGRSLGGALWYATKRDERNPSGKHSQSGVEARFTAAMDAHTDDLVKHLQGLISLCESAGQGLDWSQFRWDLFSLLDDDDEKRDKTRLRWAKDFWQGPPNHTQSNNSEGTEQ